MRKGRDVYKMKDTDVRYQDQRYQIKQIQSNLSEMKRKTRQDISMEKQQYKY